MPKIAVEIEWDVPNEPSWLSADNVAIALHAYRKNTKFKVREENKVDKFQKELEALINIHSIENASNTPDFLLAEFLVNCLRAFNLASRQKEGWFTEETVEKTASETAGLSASEAVYGFASWLTTRTECVVISSKDDAAVVCELVDVFCRANQFVDPREGWENQLVHPRED